MKREVTYINPGPNRYPEGGGMAPASVKRGVNLLNAVFGASNAATTIEINAEGDVQVFANGEELMACTVNGDVKKFYHKGECQAPGGKKYGTIKSLEVVGSGRFNLVVT